MSDARSGAGPPFGGEPAQSPLHPAVYEQFRVAFGAPHKVVGKNHQWSLRRLSYIAAVNVLVNGSTEHPVVWVFDPHSAGDGVSETPILREQDIAPLILIILEKVRSAGAFGSR
jgi:hypothetical protein